MENTSSDPLPANGSHQLLHGHRCIDCISVLSIGMVVAPAFSPRSATARVENITTNDDITALLADHLQPPKIHNGNSLVSTIFQRCTHPGHNAP